MPMMRLVRDDDGNAAEPAQPSLRFPVDELRAAAPESTRAAAEDVFAAIDTVSRRIDDLARELNCLGWFDNDDDGPRAA